MTAKKEASEFRKAKKQVWAGAKNRTNGADALLFLLSLIARIRHRGQVFISTPYSVYDGLNIGCMIHHQKVNGIGFTRSNRNERTVIFAGAGMSTTINRADLKDDRDCGCLDQIITDDDGCICLASSIVQIIGRKYSFRLLSLIADHGVIRFNEIKSEMGEISSSTLTIRLSELEEAGLIKRRTFAEIPPRVEYSPSAEGAALRKRLLSLSRFAARRKAPDGENH